MIHFLLFAKSKKSLTRPYVFVRVQLSTISWSVAEGAGGWEEEWCCRPRRQSQERAANEYFELKN